jgi:Lectin C-type domain
MVSYNGHLYGAVRTKMKWVDADAYANQLDCCNRKGHLVTAATVEERAVMEALYTVGTGENFWIGMYTSNSVWIWTGTGDPVDRVNVMTIGGLPLTNGYSVAGRRIPGTLVASYAIGTINSSTQLSVVEFDCN